MPEQLNAAAILEELRAIAMARATDFIGVRDGQLEIRETRQLTPEQCAAIASIEKGTGGLKFKFYDKLKALELLGKYMGLFDAKAAWQDDRQSNLLEAIVASTGEEVDTADIPEIQQAAESGNDLVEPSPS